MATETRDNRASTLRTVAGTVGVLFCHFTALMTLISVLVGVLGHYIVFCKEWNLNLPDVTVYAISLSYWMSAYWYLLVLGLVPDGIVYFMLARLNPKLNWCAAVWAFAPLILTIVLLGFVATAMCIPLRQLSPSQHDTTAESLHGQLRGRSVSSAERCGCFAAYFGAAGPCLATSAWGLAGSSSKMGSSQSTWLPMSGGSPPVECGSAPLSVTRTSRRAAARDHPGT